MQRVRNRLLILMAVLAIGLVSNRGVANATGLQNFIDRNGAPTNTNSLTGEPDNPGVKSAVTVTGTQEAGGVPQLSRALWTEWAIRVWAAIHLGAIR